MSADATLSKHAGIARACASKQWRRLSVRSRCMVDLDDLAQEAMIACWRAIADYDPTSRKPLATWIAWRVKCHLVDYLRSECIFRRSDGIKALRHPSQFIEGFAVIVTPGYMRRVEDRIDAGKVLRVIAGRDRQVVERWSRGETLLEIGRDFGVGQPRATQLKDRAIKSARIALRIAS